MADLLPDVDVILGTDWLTQYEARLCYDQPQPHVSVVKNNRRKHIPVYKAQSGSGVAQLSAVQAEPVFLTAKQASKALRQGCASWLCVVRAENQPHGVLGAFNTSASAEDDVFGPHELDQLLGEYKDVTDPLTELPPERPGLPLHPIKLTSTEAPYRRPMRMSPAEQEEVKRQVADLLAKGFIEPSSSPFGAPVLFVQKKDGSLRMCIDYRQLNKITVRDRYPLPRAEDLIDRMTNCRVFSALDMQSGYHQLRIAPEDVEKTSFVTNQGQFQFRVLPFGLTNAPATFQRVMNALFHDYIDQGIVACFLDDLVVMSASKEEHMVHLRLVLERLRQFQFKIKLSKCEFGKRKVLFLGHVVGNGELSVDPAKVAVLKEWPVPKDLSQLRGFLGLANYFRKFIRNYSLIAAPLTDLTSTTRAAVYTWHDWQPKELNAFEQLRAALISTPVLALPDCDKPFQVLSDASDLGCGAVLLQEGRAVAYTSRKFSSAELNYTVTEKELLGLVHALQVWRCYLEGSEVELLTDHRPLEFLRQTKDPPRRVVRWIQFLERYQYSVRYLRGKDNAADVLSRHPGFKGTVAVITTRSKARQEAPAVGGEVHVGVRLDESEIDEMQDVDEPEQAEPLLETISKAYADDPRFSDPEFVRYLRRAPGGLFLMNEKIAVPAVPDVIRAVLFECHDAPSAGHRGIRKTRALVERRFWWPTMARDVIEYVQSCESCQRMKPSAQRKAGLLQPLPVPRKRFESLSMDFIVKLPKTKRGYDSILVIVDRLSKYALFIPTVESLKAKGLARLFIQHVFADHGLPKDIVTDRGALFVSDFWQELCALLGMKRKLSTAYHPQTDGQTERMNRVLEEVLRMYVRPDQSDWDEWLSVVQFSVNNSRQESIRCSPFEMLYGESPNAPVDVELPQPGKAAGAGALSKVIQRLVRQARHYLLEAQQKMAKYVNQSRRDVHFTPGEWVLLSTQNMRLNKDGQVRKLLPRYVGPFAVQQMIGKVAVQLVLPAPWNRFHNVFHVSLLKPFVQRPGVELQPHMPPLEWVANEPVFEINEITRHQVVPFKPVSGQFRFSKFEVNWVGCDPTSTTWIEAQALDELPQGPGLIERYRAKTGLNRGYAVGLVPIVQ